MKKKILFILTLCLSFAPLDYLISFHKSEKNIDEILKLKNYIEKYPLLSLLYKDKIDGILSKI